MPQLRVFWGYFLYGFGPVVPLLRDEQGVSAALAGLHGTALAVGIVFGGMLFPPLARRFGPGADDLDRHGRARVRRRSSLWVARPLRRRPSPPPFVAAPRAGR